MLTYELKKSPGVPLYEALYRAIRSDILSGALTSTPAFSAAKTTVAELSKDQEALVNRFIEGLGDAL